MRGCETKVTLTDSSLVKCYEIVLCRVACELNVKNSKLVFCFSVGVQTSLFTSTPSCVSSVKASGLNNNSLNTIGQTQFSPSMASGSRS